MSDVSSQRSSSPIPSEFGDDASTSVGTAGPAYRSRGARDEDRVLDHPMAEMGDAERDDSGDAGHLRSDEPRSTKRPQLHRCCVFTLHADWRQDDLMEIILSSLKSLTEYFVVGRESCPTTGRPHLQGYAEFKSGKDLVRFGSRIVEGHHAHVEPRKGTQEQAIAYCKKDMNFVEWGVKKAQGKRKDIDVIRDGVKDGTLRTARDIYETVSSYQAYRFGTIGLSLYSGRRSEFRGIEWHYGATGTGKSASAFSRYPDAYVWDTGVWWEGYAGERVVIIDDFRADRVPFARLLRICDRYPLRVEYKGGSIELLAELVVITAPVDPGTIYGDIAGGAGDVGQLWRRCIAMCEHRIDDEGDHCLTWWRNPGGVGAGGLRGLVDDRRPFETDEFEPVVCGPARLHAVGVDREGSSV